MRPLRTPSIAVLACTVVCILSLHSYTLCLSVSLRLCTRNLTGAWCGDRFKAVDDHVRSGMVVGLGTGSTAFFAVQRVGQKLKTGELSDIICIPTVFF